MARRRDRGRGRDVEHAGRVTHTDCPVRGDDRPCLPLHRITRWGVDGGKVTDLCTCSCGRRFSTGHPEAAEHLVAPVAPGEAVVVEPGASATWTMAEVQPFDAEEPRAAKGVVPVETEALHHPTRPVGEVTRDVKALAKHMIKVMHRAPGVGLAANQVGVSLRLFVQVHRRALPETLVDPEVRATEGTWTYPEGCLSLQVEDTDARLVRPRRIQVRARTLHGDVLEATLDEVVARICQHEIDHLDGIEYVQRLTGDDGRPGLRRHGRRRHRHLLAAAHALLNDALRELVPAGEGRGVGQEDQPGVARAAPIGDHAVIGDGRAVALVDRAGVVDWMTLPEDPRTAVFDALLAPAEGGRFLLAPEGDVEVDRRYRSGSMVLETRFRTTSGELVVTDCFTRHDGARLPWVELARRARCTSGRIDLAWAVEPSMLLGRTPTGLRSHHDLLQAEAEGFRLGLLPWDAGDPEHTDRGVRGRTAMVSGDEALLTLVLVVGEPLPRPDRAEVASRIDRTVETWRDWSKGIEYEGRWRDQVHQSARALRLLIHEPDGAVMAAPTTSLPERPGGPKNYDYRYCWIRDASFTIDALLRIGLVEEAHHAITALLRMAARTAPHLAPFYRADGQVPQDVTEVDVPGYRGSQPVQEGNAAAGQLQLGSWGDLFEAVWLYVRRGNDLDEGTGRLMAGLADRVCEIWSEEDAGMWELPATRHYTISKMRCWMALDRALRLAEADQLEGETDRWRREQSRGPALRRGAVLVRREGRASPSTPTPMTSTPRASWPRGSASSPATTSGCWAPSPPCGPSWPRAPFVWRYSGERSEEGAFLACSFWLAEALLRAGRLAEAEDQLDGVLAAQDGLGLMSEQYAPGAGRDARELPPGPQPPRPGQRGQRTTPRCARVRDLGAIERARIGKEAPAATSTTLDEEAPCPAPPSATRSSAVSRSGRSSGSSATRATASTGSSPAWSGPGTRPRFVQARHEEMAAFEACGYAKFTGRVGVCLATSGPGAIHLLNGLYDAKLDHVPVVAIVGQQARTALGGSYQQEVDLQSLFKDVAHEYVHTASAAQQFPLLIDRAIRTAIGREDGHLRDRAQRPPGGGVGGPRARLQGGAVVARHGTAAGRAVRRGHRPRRRGPGLGPEAGDPGGPGRPGRSRPGARAGRPPGRGGGQGPAGQGRPPRRPPPGHRAHRPARLQAQLRHDDGGRHLPDGRLQHPLQPVPPALRSGPRGADRHRSQDDRHPVPDGGQPRRRRPRHPRPAAAPARRARGPQLAGRPQGGHLRLVGDRRAAGDGRRGPREPAAGLLGAVVAPARRRHHHRRLRLRGQLVRPRPQVPGPDAGLAVGHPRHHGARACPTPSAPSSATPTDPSSPASATGRCR